MTSSFGTIVGKERDVIPDLSATNYGATEPDLTDSVNAQIDANIQDTQNFYNEMAEIQKLIAETPMRNLESLAQFSQSASQAMKALKARKEAQDKIKEAMSFMDNNLLEELRDADGKFNLQDAKVNNQLFKENTKESINFLHTRTTVEPEDISIKELLRRQKESYFGARQQIVNERGGKKLTDIDEYMKLHGAADELMITAMLMEAEKLGIDTNSRKFRRLFYEKMWPDIQQRKENNIQTWKAESNRNYERNRNDKLDKIIVDTFNSFMENNFSVCRFNFRGVGKSDGEFDNGQGELADAAAALDWLERENFDNSQCWISGFSFGSLIAMQLLMRRPEINRFVVVSPQPNVYDFSFLSPCPTSGTMIYGKKDELIFFSINHCTRCRTR